MRNIEKEMIAWLDAKLKTHGGAQEAIRTKNARLLFGYANDVCVGIREKGGNNKGPLVELMQETLGGADKEPWCMSAQQTLIAYCEVKCKVKSPIYASEHCLTVWNNTPKAQRVKNIPASNALIVWRHGTTQSGHTGCMREWQNKTMLTCEGNTEGGTSPNGEVVREGGGFYMLQRSVKGTGSMKVVGFLKPF